MFIKETINIISEPRCLGSVKTNSLTFKSKEREATRDSWFRLISCRTSRQRMVSKTEHNLWFIIFTWKPSFLNKRISQRQRQISLKEYISGSNSLQIAFKKCVLSIYMMLCMRDIHIPCLIRYTTLWYGKLIELNSTDQLSVELVC